MFQGFFETDSDCGTFIIHLLYLFEMVYPSLGSGHSSHTNPVGAQDIYTPIAVMCTDQQLPLGWKADI